MKGLLIKDFHLMKIQKRFFIVIIGLSVLLTASMNEVSFIIGYLTLVMPMFATGTLGYDEFDNGNAFLFTLPISRREYVLEKYCFAILLGVIALSVGILLTLGFGAVKDMNTAWEAIQAAPISFAAMLLLSSIMLPLQIKFGAEKSRIAMIVLVGSILVLGWGILNLFSFCGIDPITAILRWVTKYPYLTLIVVMAAVLLALLLSVTLSLRMMKKKEF